jgi:hypothetical protein
MVRRITTLAADERGAEWVWRGVRDGAGWLRTPRHTPPIGAFTAEANVTSTPDMTDLILLPASRNGSWEYDGVSRREAQFALDQCQAAQEALRALLVQRKSRSAFPREGTEQLTAALLARNFFASATVLFACVAIESFLNHYGVRRFGPAFNEREYEGLTAAKKARVILSHTAPGELGDGDALFASLKRLYGRRNRLVHPKTHEYRPDADPPPIDAALGDAAQESIDDMATFFARFSALDSEAMPFVAGF